jgi:hypothetical protein
MQWRPTILTHNTSRATRNKLTKHPNNNTSTIRSFRSILNEMLVPEESTLHLHTTNIDTVPLRAPNNSLLTPTSNRRNNRSNAASSRHRVLHTTWHNAFKLVRGHASNEPAVRCILTASLNNARHHPRHSISKRRAFNTQRVDLALQLPVHVVRFVHQLLILSQSLPELIHLSCPCSDCTLTSSIPLGSTQLRPIKPLSFHTLKPLPKPINFFSKFADLR